MLKDFYKEPEELVMGAAVSMAFVCALDAWTFLAVLLTSHLWRLGGVTGGDKLFRRLGVPVTISGLLVLSHGLSIPFAALSTVLGFAVLTMGYGIPRGNDKGSNIGRFWVRVTKSLSLADCFTRATVGLLLALAYLPLLWNDWVAWVVVVLSLPVMLPLIEEVVQ